MLLTRRRLRIGLGVSWMLDGVLQLKPAMFTKAFVQQVLLPNAQGQPGWVAAPIDWFSTIAASHLVLWDAAFAAVQLCIGVALVVGLLPRLALGASVLWALGVWWVGEGFGGLAPGGALTLTGAPGAGLLYGLAAVALWPPREQSRPEVPWVGRELARWSLVVLWIAGAALQLQGQYLAGSSLGAAFAVRWAADLAKHHAATVSIMLAALELAIAAGLLVPKARPAAAWAGILLSLLYWWIGQSFGQMFTALGTDPNAGPLWVLLTLCAFPMLFDRRSSPPDSRPPGQPASSLPAAASPAPTLRSD